MSPRSNRFTALCLAVSLSLLVVPAVVAAGLECAVSATPLASTTEGTLYYADGWGKRAGITCGEQYTGNSNSPGEIASYCIGCCADAMGNNPPIDQWNNCISHCNKRAAGTITSVTEAATGSEAGPMASTGFLFDDKEINCSNNGDCPESKQWCTHCRDGKSIPEEQWFCAGHDEHLQHEKGCTGVAIE